MQQKALPFRLQCVTEIKKKGRVKISYFGIFIVLVRNRKLKPNF